MKMTWKMLIVTLVIAVPAFLMGAGSPQGESMWRAIWPWEMETGMEPTSGQFPFFLIMGAIEALAFGLAIAFLVFGRSWAKAMVPDAPGGSGLVTVAVAWILGNWWIHTSLHIVNGENFTGLLVIEYAFHATLVLAGAYLLFALMKNASARPATA